MTTIQNLIAAMGTEQFDEVFFDLLINDLVF